MPGGINTRDLDSLAGAVYFTVGRGTEGGSASYRLSVAGVTRSDWGKVGSVAANSGYSMGTIQVDFGQRGTWPLGSIEGRAPRTGESSYVDAVITQSSSYARKNGLVFTDDMQQLRSDLLSHGNGKGGRSSIAFIDSGTRDSINAWASSNEGKQWIHRNIDYPQVRNATREAMSILERTSHKVAENNRFEAISILAKTANQFPSQLQRLEDVLKNGGDYDALLSETKAIKSKYGFYDGPKAASLANAYERNYEGHGMESALDRAHTKVSDPSFDPSTEAYDSDIRTALGAIGQRTLSGASRDNDIQRLQQNLNKLHIPDAQGRQLVADGNAGPRTQQAIESFQRQHGIPVDGKATPQLLSATQIAVSVTEALSSSQQFSREYSAQPNTPPGWAGVPHEASTQTVHVPRSAERTASTERVAAAAQFDGVRVRVDSTEQLHPRQMARAPVATSVSELDRDAVVSLQRDLNRLGFTDPRGRPLAEDGHHGPNTQAAVSAFQREQGLPPTGMADPVTLSAVNAHAIVANLQQQRDERENPAAFQAQARAFDAQQAAPRSPDHDPLGRETATLHEARSTQASGFGELRGTYLPPSGGSPAVDVIKSSGRVADALDHTAMRHVERGPHRLEAASNAVPSAEPASMRDARDPQHPDHAFYRAIADKLPGAYAEAGLSVPGREAQERVAASLSAQARSQGVVSADHVVIGGGEQGNIFVVQGRLDDPAHLRTHLPLQEAQSAPLQESFQQLQQASQPLARDQQAQHEHAQQRAQGAAMSM